MEVNAWFLISPFLSGNREQLCNVFLLVVIPMASTAVVYLHLVEAVGLKP